MNNLNNVWVRKDHIKQSLRIQLYKSHVKPILTYNYENKKKKTLMHFIDNKYPARIGNTQVYQQTGEEALSLDTY